MATIIVADHITPVQALEDGTKIFQMIKLAFKNQEQVTLSFEKVDSVVSSFINSSIVMLLEDFSIDYIKSNLKIIHSNSQINKMINYCLETAMLKKGEKSIERHPA